LAAVRRNAIASLALAVAVLALAGGAYATLRLPAGSVTNRAIANHTITPGKLNTSGARSFGGYVGDWASVNASGQVVASSRQTQNDGASAVNGLYAISWHPAGSTALDRIGRCVPEVTVQGSTAFPPPGGFATAITKGNAILVETYSASGVSTPESFYLTVIC
jgi:hypothetical protein